MHSGDGLEGYLGEILCMWWSLGVSCRDVSVAYVPSD